MVGEVKARTGLNTEDEGSPPVRILLYPNPSLRRPAEPVTRIDAELRHTVRQMFDLMYEAAGIGLAATQVGLPLRLFVVNLTGRAEDETVLVNPEVLTAEGEQTSEEGCLSLPGVTGTVRRPLHLVVRGYDLEGDELEYEGRETFARVVCHEMDHLAGQLIIDRMGPAARLGNRARLKELEESYRSRAGSTS